METPNPYPDDSIDLAELAARVRRRLLAILGLTLIGLASGVMISLAVTSKRTAVSTLRVTFGFPGFERGTYPNGTKFQADDLRAPDVVNEAIKRLGIQAAGPDIVSKIRGAIGISGFVSPNIIKERDRLRAGGQVLPPYFADEYELSLSLPRDHALDVRQRELLLAEIVNIYMEKFQRTYVLLPPEFGNVFASVKNADFVEYELILTRELHTLSSYLEQKINTGDNPDGKDEKGGAARAGVAKQFRSPTNNLSFQDLLKQTEVFTQVRLNDVLSQIYVHGLSKDRSYALVKMDYYLRTLQDQEQRLLEEEAVVMGLLEKTQGRGQNYVLASKTQNPQGGQPLVDQSFVDSLLANDAYNFLVRRALDAGLAVRRVQSDKARLQERRSRMESFMKEEVRDQAEAIARTQKALAELESGYQDLLGKVRVVLDDYARQEYADAVRITKQAETRALLADLILGALAGAGTGLVLGLGLALIRPAPLRAPV
jgi:hypothetical protein